MGSKAIKAKKKTKREQIEEFLEHFTLSINLLICNGHSNAWDYEYEQYKIALRHLKKFEQLQVMTFATAISIVFGGKKAVNQYLRENK